MGVQEPGSTGAAQPRSWAEDLGTYRSTRGSRSFATTSAPAKRFGRTCLVPFADTTHPLYQYNDFPQHDGGTKTQQDPSIQSERYFRHGWGDTSLLKEDEYAGVPHPRGTHSAPQGKRQPGSPRGKDGRDGLFGVLQQTEAGGLDSWIGNALINPTAGKRALLPPQDPRGRRDLFDVLHARNPGKPSDDSWLGNQLINPAKGKASVPGPEQRRGRRDLTDTFTQSILREPNRAELLKKGADPLSDAWCGHMLIDPNKGKAPIQDSAKDLLIGAAFKPPVPDDWTDFPKPHARQVEAPVPDMARQVIDGTAPLNPADFRRGKKEITEQLGNRLDHRKDLYANMTFRPLSNHEQQLFAKTTDDGHIGGRRYLQEPGSTGIGQGSDMLAWKPELALGQFVPYGKLAQQGKDRNRGVNKLGVPGGSMNRPMPIPRALSLNSSSRF